MAPSPMDIDKSKSKSKSKTRSNIGSPMDIDQPRRKTQSKSNSKSKTESKSKQPSMTHQNAATLYGLLLHKALPTATSVLSKRDILTKFHPDKMPKPLAEYARKDPNFNNFVNHMFHELSTRKYEVDLQDCVRILQKYALADLNLILQRREYTPRNE